MTDYVIMPKADYEAACDAIREKTGKTDLIKSGDLAAEIHNASSTDNSPQLHAPSVYGPYGTGSQYFSIESPSLKNGGFANGVCIYSGEQPTVDNLLYTGEIPDGSTSVAIYANDLTMPEGVNKIHSKLGACLSGNGFLTSPIGLSSSYASIMRIIYQLDNVDITPKNSIAFLSDRIVYQLTPSTGYYLPKRLNIEVGSYNPDDGTITVDFSTLLETGYTISVTADTQPWLKPPMGDLDSTAAILTATFPDNSTGLMITVEDEDPVYVAREDGQSAAIVDLSELLQSKTSCIVSVIATANGYTDSDSVELAYIPALVDINIAGNSLTNLGTGGSTYNAYFSNGATSSNFTNGKFKVSNGGALTIPTSFMSKSATSPWTIAFAIDNYTPNTSRSYCRFARGNKDVPSIYYMHSGNKSNLFKMANSTANSSILAWYDTNIIKPYSSSTGVLCVPISTNTRSIIGFRNDGTYISMWVNGEKLAEQVATAYTSSYWATTFSIGNDVSTVTYNMTSMECSMLKAWDRALPDSEMSKIA